MTVWILIHVLRGFIQEPQIFYDAVSAEARRSTLLQDFNPDYDELEMFEQQVREEPATA